MDDMKTTKASPNICMNNDDVYVRVHTSTINVCIQNSTTSKKFIEISKFSTINKFYLFSVINFNVFSDLYSHLIYPCIDLK